MGVLITINLLCLTEVTIEALVDRMRVGVLYIIIVAFDVAGCETLI